MGAATSLLWELIPQLQAGSYLQGSHPKPQKAETLLCFADEVSSKAVIHVTEWGGTWPSLGCAPDHVAGMEYPLRKE